MSYTPIFTKPYADGYKNRPNKSTPVTAEIKNKETETLLAIEAFLAALNIPSKLSELVNDKNFIDATVSNLANYYLKSETYARTETYTQAEVQALIADAVSKVSGKLNILVVDALPTSDISTTTFYLVPKETAQEKNVYDEYINTDGTESGWELIGAVSTSVDLSEYYKKAEVDTLLANKVNTSDLVASSFSGTKAIIGNQIGGKTCEITIMTEKEYNDIADKKSIEGIVGIASGAIIKKWIDPSRIIDPVYLATTNSVIAESYLENADVEKNTWGNLVCNGQISLYDDNKAIYAPGNTSGVYLSFDLGESNHDCTIYLVSKALQNDTQNRRMIEVCYSATSNNCPIVAERSGNMQYSIFNSDTNTSNPVTEYCVIALSLSSSATSDKAKFYYNGELAGTKNQSNFGQHVLFGGSHMPNTNCDMAIKYIAVVDGIDDQDTVVANMQSLMTAFGIGNAESGV